MLCVKPYVSTLGTKISSRKTGIPDQYLVKQEHQTTYKGASVYLCPHLKCQTPTYWAQSPSVMYSHICCKHLGLALAYPYCKMKVFWNSKGWKSHMDSKHKGLPTYSTDLQDEAQIHSSFSEQCLTRCGRPSSNQEMQLIFTCCCQGGHPHRR